jgi:hypothetical protein
MAGKQRGKKAVVGNPIVAVRTKRKKPGRVFTLSSSFGGGRDFLGGFSMPPKITDPRTIDMG